MSKSKKNPQNMPKERLVKSMWDYFAAIAFILAGSYFLATQRSSQGAIYILVGIFFVIITKSRENKKK